MGVCRGNTCLRSLEDGSLAWGSGKNDPSLEMKALKEDCCSIYPCKSWIMTLPFYPRVSKKTLKMNA